MNRIKKSTRGGAAARSRSAGGAGFTLIEIMVVIGLIAVLIALVASGLNRASKTARRAASQQSASSLAQAVDQFKKEFGFFPPLVHDGIVVSNDEDQYRPLVLGGSVSEDGPVVDVPDGPYEYQRIVVWNDGVDFNFFRRRAGRSGGDSINLPGGGEWNDEAAWDDRRYSKYSLAYYLLGALDKRVDGVQGPGFARPIIDGTFVGIGYPVGSVRDRFDPIMDVERRGARLVPDYVEPRELAEHGGGDDLPTYDETRNLYEDQQKPALLSIVDSFGTAFRYYRWEPGRFENGQLVVENPLDLNLPPVLVDPRILAQVMNDPQQAEIEELDLTAGNPKLRDARYAVVSAGPDRFFGTENIDTIADFLGSEVPGDLEGQAELRREVWIDNVWEVGS